METLLPIDAAFDSAKHWKILFEGDSLKIYLVYTENGKDVTVLFSELKKHYKNGKTLISCLH